MIHRGAVMSTRYNHSTTGAANRSAPDQTIHPNGMAVVDPRASRQTYDRLDSHDIDAARWKGPVLASCGTRT